jgi:hypothetical protein
MDKKYGKNRKAKFFAPKFIVAPRHPWRGEFIAFDHKK